MTKTWRIVLAGIALIVPAPAEVELPALFSDGLVVQRDRPWTVWGRARPGERVHATIAGASAETSADERGRWRIELDALPAGGPHRLRIAGSNEIVVRDVWVGEVWIGSGQSNMRMTVAYSRTYDEARATAERPRLRMFRETSLPSPEPTWRGSGEWVVCTPETVGEFSGVLYFFGAELQDRLDGVPLGLIDSSVGGTPIECWTSRPAQEGHPGLVDLVTVKDAAFRSFDPLAFDRSYKERIAGWKRAVQVAEAAGEKPPKRPWNLTEYHLRVGNVGELFNGKVAPLAPYSIRGVLWYQGENNVFAADLYEEQLRTLIADWRAHWERPDLPFLWIQLPNFGDGRPGSNWPGVREGQRRALCLPDTGMVVTIDIGDGTDIHPRNKRDFGLRAARCARALVYGHRIVPTGPLVERVRTEGARAIVLFEHARELRTLDGEAPRMFELADSEGRWHPANARIEGARITLWSKAVEHPTAARYAWANRPPVNLVNLAGLPAAPFWYELTLGTRRAKDGAPAVSRR